MVISLVKHLCPGAGVEATSIAMQGNDMVPARIVDRIENPHLERFVAGLRFRKRIVASERRRFNLFESRQKPSPRRLLPHQPLR
jgi:hypothetical protein